VAGWVASRPSTTWRRDMRGVYISNLTCLDRHVICDI
jgi:hypothetical protein